MEASRDTEELFRCCLLRTLLSYDGHTTEDGGTVLRPDLASALPSVSADGLTWTFALRRGVHYSPPLQNVEVTADDFIRAFRREARLGKQALGSYYDGIAGFDAYGAGQTDSIAGLEAPDPHTLIIRLTHSEGDLGDRLVLSGTAPIPPLPDNPTAPFGVATGHDANGYGAYLVSTGPYMVEGAETLNFSKPPSAQPKLPGLTPGRLITLVRNPSWNAASDPLRAAYADRIEIRIVADDPALIAHMITSGAADVDLDYRPPQPFLLTVAQRLLEGNSVGEVHVASRDFLRFVSMNLAVPPFDDIAVRRAVNYAIDKARVRQLEGGALEGAVAGHLEFDSIENNVLVAYDPYRSAGGAGDIAAAKRQMAMSRYDANHDGVCDVPACRNVLGLTIATPAISQTAASQEIARNLAEIGIQVRVVTQTPPKTFTALADPQQKIPLGLALGSGRAILNGSDFVSVYSSSDIGIDNYSLLGATQAQLHHWGYRVSSVPGVDARIGECGSLVGDPQVGCWASLDQYLMEQVVPWVPLVFENDVFLTSARVVAYSYDQLDDLPALDRLAVRPGS